MDNEASHHIVLLGKDKIIIIVNRQVIYKLNFLFGRGDFATRESVDFPIIVKVQTRKTYLAKGSPCSCFFFAKHLCINGQDGRQPQYYS